MSARIALLSPAVGTGNVGDHLIEVAVRRLLGTDVDYLRVGIRDPLEPAAIDAINTTGAAIICGTNLYQRDWHSALTPPDIARLRVPIIPLGVGSSAGHLSDTAVSATTQRMIQAIHSRCVAGSVRDLHSAQVVARAGVGNVIVTGCPVLFWQQGDALPAVRPARRTRIVIAARNWLMHRWPDNVDHPVQIRFLQRLLQSFPLDRLTFAIHEAYDERLVHLLNIPPEIVFQSDDATEYVRLYSDDRNIVVAMRLHAGMLAVANGVPALFIGHDTRTTSFCSMLQLPCADLFSNGCADWCIEGLRRAIDADVSFLAPSGAAFVSLRHAMNEFLRVNGLPSAAVAGATAAPA